MTEHIVRDVMEYDVVAVGAGSGRIAWACRVR